MTEIQSMSLFIPSSTQVRGHAREMLLRYANGEIPDWRNGHDGPIEWVKYSHRGIQRLDNIHIGKKQKRDIFNDQFQIRYDQAFEQVVRCCADLKRQGKTWITEELIDGYLQLHHLGYAHSYEAWQDGKLVGGAFGIHIGGWISVDSMFHHVDNASKAAYGQTLIRLRDRGFQIVDVNVVSPYMAYFGAEWIPRWQFEVQLRELIPQNLSLLDDRPPTPLPPSIRLRLKLHRVARALGRRLKVGQEKLIRRETAAEPSALEENVAAP